MSMECLEFRRIAGGDPGCRAPAFAEHAAQCEACAQHLRQLVALDELILRALRLDVPGEEPAAPAARPRGRLQWLGLAASLVLAIGVGAGVWLSHPADSLAADVVAHMQHEADAMQQTAERVDPGLLRDVIDRSGARLAEGIGEVSYARTCLFRGKLVPHLVVQSDTAPVTVLVLPDEHVSRPMPIDEEGFHGRIVPVGTGSLAIVGRSDESIETIETRFLNALQWHPDF